MPDLRGFVAGIALALVSPVLTAPIQIDSVSPTALPSGGGTTVTVVGSGFTDRTVAKIGGMVLADQRLLDSGTRIAGNAPALPEERICDVTMEDLREGNRDPIGCSTLLRSDLDPIHHAGQDVLPERHSSRCQGHGLHGQSPGPDRQPWHPFRVPRSHFYPAVTYRLTVEPRG